MSDKPISGADLAVGGQAVIEGVLMQNREKYSISVRDPEGKIVNKTVKKRKKGPISMFFRKTWFVRGNFALVDSLKIGYGALNYSVEVSTGEEDDTGGFWGVLMILLSIVIALALFKYLPFLIPTFFTNTTDRFFTLYEGLIKLGIFVGYIVLIGMAKDIRRVFEYHGAEHKAVHCYEKYGNSKRLTAKNAQKFSRLHKRCGTTFLFLVVFISFIVYTFFPPMSFWAGFGLRILFLPVIAGISYEILQVVPKLSKWNPLRWILIAFEYPGMLIQRMTTREPDLKQLDVAIHSLKKVI